MRRKVFQVVRSFEERMQVVLAYVKNGRTVAEVAAEQRPYISIGYQTPNEAHQQTGEQKRMWRHRYMHCSITM